MSSGDEFKAAVARLFSVRAEVANLLAKLLAKVVKIMLIKLYTCPLLIDTYLDLDLVPLARWVLRLLAANCCNCRNCVRVWRMSKIIGGSE